MNKAQNLEMIKAEMAKNGITPKITILKAKKAPKASLWKKA